MQEVVENGAAEEDLQEEEENGAAPEVAVPNAQRALAVEAVGQLLGGAEDVWRP